MMIINLTHTIQDGLPVIKPNQIVIRYTGQP